jgi:transformation/transcription domain-associated protein
LSGEVSSGAVEAAKSNLEKVLRICVAVEDVHLAPLRESSLAGVTIELVRHVTSNVTNVREQSMKNLKLLAELQGKTLSEIIQPHVSVIADMIPPKKHLIRHQSLQSQLGILDGNSFCLSLVPKLFAIDFTLPEHRSFIPEVVGLCESDDATLAKLPCYKGVTNLFPVRISILKVLGCVVVPTPLKERIISLFLKSLSNSNDELQVAAFESMQKFMLENQVEVELVSLKSAI